MISRFSFEVKAIYNPVTTLYTEELSIWVTVADNDGLGDVQELKLTLMDEGLEWVFSKEQWLELPNADESTIGYVKIQGPDPRKVPLGRYTVHITDSAYNTSSRSFMVSDPGYAVQEFIPRMTRRSASLWNLESRFTVNYIYAIDELGEVAGFSAYAPGLIKLPFPIYRTNPVYIIVRYRGRALLSGPYFLDSDQ